MHVLPNCTILVGGFAKATFDSSSWHDTLNLIGAAVLTVQVPSEMYSAIGRTVFDFTRVWHLLATALESFVNKALTQNWFRFSGYSAFSTVQKPTNGFEQTSSSSSVNYTNFVRFVSAAMAAESSSNLAVIDLPS